VRLFYKEDESDDTVVQPDISVICDKEQLGEEGCHGAPSLVVEILSPSNSESEMRRKYELYCEAGVREYWVVSPERQSVAVYRLAGDEYAFTTLKAPGVLASSVLKGLEIDLETVFAAP
jgi:Uma2 family endonuclease